MDRFTSFVVLLVAVLSLGVSVVALSKAGSFSLGSETQAAFTAADLTSRDDLTVTDDAAIGDDLTVTGDITFKEKVAYIAATSQYSTTTLVAANSGTTYYQSASGTSIVLPAVTTTGFTVRIVTGAALDTASTTITSAEGDNINGTLRVNAADVACSGEDYININPDLETVGDYIELRSNGTSWYIGDSIFDTAASVTCTNPS